MRSWPGGPTARMKRFCRKSTNLFFCFTFPSTVTYFTHTLCFLSTFTAYIVCRNAQKFNRIFFTIDFLRILSYQVLKLKRFQKSGDVNSDTKRRSFYRWLTRLGWLCYEDIVISSALTVKGTNQTDCVWFLHLSYRDLAYLQPENPAKTPWIDKQISHQCSTIYNSPRYSFHLVPG